MKSPGVAKHTRYLKKHKKSSPSQNPYQKSTSQNHRDHASEEKGRGQDQASSAAGAASVLAILVGDSGSSPSFSLLSSATALALAAGRPRLRLGVASPSAAALAFGAAFLRAPPLAGVDLGVAGTSSAPSVVSASLSGSAAAAVSPRFFS